MVIFVGEVNGERLMKRGFPGPFTQIPEPLRAIRMRPLGVGVCGNRVRVAEKLFKGFVDVDHGQGSVQVVGWVIVEVERDERRHGHFKITMIDHVVGPFLQFRNHHVDHILVD
ncbi:hypothetical protein D3C71_1471020 [compost metagenome]